MRERQHFEVELRDLQLSGVPDLTGHEVFEPDSRQRVTDSTAVPFRWICHVVTELTNGDTALGTGFLIGSRWVLTAAHCIYPLPKDVERSTAAKPARPIYKVRRIRVYPGRHGSREPFGEVVANGWIVHPDWAVGRNGSLLLAGVHQGKAAWTGANNRRIDVNHAVRYSRDLAVRIARWMSPATWRATR